MPTNTQEVYRTLTRLDQQRKSKYKIYRTTTTTTKRILKVVREKGQVTYKGRLIRPDFKTETVKAKRAWTDNLQPLRKHMCQPKLLYPVKLNQHRGRKEDISRQIEIQTISIHKSTPAGNTTRKN